MDAERNENTALPEEKTTLGRELHSIIRDFCFILAAVTVIFVFVVRLVGVSGSSMFPTLVNRDYMLLASNFLCGEYDRGDIVVARVPSFGREPIVKRVIATEGQTVDIDFITGTVYVDGTALDEPYICDQNWSRNYSDGLPYPVVVPEDCYFLMGDNRDHSTDSRYSLIGMVPEEYIMGKVLCILLPGKQTNELGDVTGGMDFSRIGAPR